jgi:hypothetical protein
MKNLSDVSSEDLLHDAFKFFKILIFVIVVNISINEAYFNMNSDLLHEIRSEAAYLSFFYFGFLFFYYLGSLYKKITTNNIHKVWLIRNWLMLIFVTTIIFQLTGVLNPDQIKVKMLEDQITKDVVIVYVIFLGIAILQTFKLIRKAQIKWYDAGFYLLAYSSFFVLIIMKGLIVQALLR